MRILLLISMLVFAPVAASAGPGAPKGWSQTCYHYKNRAMFVPRDQLPLAPLVIMAESCADAFAKMSGRNTPAEIRSEAIAYLDRLTLLRRTIIEMNVSRIHAVDHKGYGTTVRRSAPSVTVTGEYLIARELGVFHAYDRWTQRGGADIAALAATAVESLPLR
ncbi:MAG: hypothetical protein AAFQ36_08795 [Pseudomonadota bacterium]